ncbi:MarR family winged helix-turn-helix transcriptional regulator [Paenibacillus sacheonensis]|uniref:Winged helix DNA-binding protein n=1 Tax=Paenibacillus sacheonensis TaxID=742054 RepID=A0A7X4YVJ5_9BACL|nr:transcriptional regulator [Paenibacillus sacheonensis]MBM7569459.1 MarR family 2-MHQ and catechol resistance regulon transcriptional repressor [Paenibacillus sacheonensis]NBC73372.1 winged helix DNA-binding protein [Paenibacillus sacheonensis]
MTEKWSPFERPVLSVDVFLSLYKTNHHLVQQLEEQLASFDLTLGRWCLLVALRSGSRAMLPSELSDDLAVTRANISNLLNSLENSGRILREFDPTNRRRILVRLTPAGHQLISDVWPVYEETIARTVGEKLTDQEQAQLKGLLKKLF